MIQSKNRTIAKNTIFLYFRMMFTMIISLYTSRVVLQILGVNDFGIYQVVGGVVTMLSFLNGALSTGSSRFLTFELGTGNKERLQRTFSTTLTVHIALAIIIVILAETIGLWFVLHKLVIPAERMSAALWVYHLSILTAVVAITQVPYDASIIAHEKMNIYAYLSIFEVLAKLGIVYLLTFGQIDRLVLYAILICIVQIILVLFYRFYCIMKFQETRFHFLVDKEILRSISGFSGWSLFTNLSNVLNNQGTAIITNMFFGPAVVTARAISIQVNTAANLFVNNFRTAINPQIVKSYATMDYSASKDLLLGSTKYSFYLMYLLGLPIILLAKPILHIWLGQVPQYSVIFLQLIIIQSLFSVFDTSFYTALYAKGQLKENALISPILGFLQFPIVYILFKLGYSPIVLSYAGIITYLLLGIIIKPILICKIVNYKKKEILNVFKSCLSVVLLSAPPSVLLTCYMDKSFVSFFAILFVTTTSVLASIWFIGIDYITRCKIKKIIEIKLYHKNDRK